MKKFELATPNFYDPRNAAIFNFRSDKSKLQAEAQNWRKQMGIRGVGADKRNIQLLIIDAQNDFCVAPEGTLYVGGRSGTGAVDDNRRIAEFIYRNLRVLTGITTTMDTHFAYQIFFPSFWLDKNDQVPAPMTMVTADAIRNGDFRPNPLVAKEICEGNYGWLMKQVEFYCEELEKAKKYNLTLWPFHCLLGDPGQNLAGIIEEARFFYAMARGAQTNCEIKGGNPLTENYSIFRPEVLMRWDGKPLAQKNTRFLDALLNGDAVAIAGQAKSHCVAWTIDDLLNEILAKDKKLVEKVYLLEDCTSPVVVPGIVDFTDDADKAFDRFKNAGMNVVKSTDPIDEWPKMII